MQRIVDYAEAQEWSGPIFSPDSGVARPAGNAHRHRGSGNGGSNPAGSAYRGSGYLGSIDGTFNQAAFGLGPNPRAADLIISFREFPDLDNQGLTGPRNPAYAIGPNGPEAQVNKSNALVHPMPGVMYADANSFTTGMGMHGAVGARELHNFCAATGPDFASGMVDDAPTGNADLAPTMGKILGQAPIPGVTGRVLVEALAPAATHQHGGRENSRARVEPITVTASRTLSHSRVTTTLELTRYAGHDYLDGADTVTTPTK
jgi:hypothetical protein